MLCSTALYCSLLCFTVLYPSPAQQNTPSAAKIPDGAAGSAGPEPAQARGTRASCCRPSNIPAALSVFCSAGLKMQGSVGKCNDVSLRMNQGSTPRQTAAQVNSWLSAGCRQIFEDMRYPIPRGAQPRTKQHNEAASGFARKRTCATTEIYAHYDL